MNLKIGWIAKYATNLYLEYKKCYFTSICPYQDQFQFQDWVKSDKMVHYILKAYILFQLTIQTMNDSLMLFALPFYYLRIIGKSNANKKINGVQMNRLWQCDD